MESCLQCIDSTETMMIKCFTNELSKTSLIGSWQTEDFDSENILFNNFSIEVRSIHVYSESLFSFIPRWEEIANKEYGQNCVEQLYE